MRLTRRSALAGLAALPLPALAQGTAEEAGGWEALSERLSRFDQFHAIMVAHQDETVLGEAVRGPGLDSIANVKSVSKTIVSALLGAAIDREVVPGLDATLGEVAPEIVPDGVDDRVSGITLRDLVTLRAGLERTSGPNYGEWIASGNWVADALSRPLVAEPGGRMLYSTGSFHVLGAALSEASGQSLLALAREWLGAPLGIEVPSWTRDPQGRYMGGNQMGLTPRALLRFGEMYRQEGRWDGAQVLPADYVAQSFDPVTRSPYSGLQYGLGWFLGEAQGAEFALARGYGGQVIFVVPSEALTVVVTSDPNLPARSDGYFGDLMEVLRGPVIDAARA